MRGLLDTIELADLVEGIDTGGQTTMKAEHLVLNHSSEGEVIEQLSELLPDVSVTILSEALIVETIPVEKKAIKI